MNAPSRQPISAPSSASSPPRPLGVGRLLTAAAPQSRGCNARLAVAVEVSATAISWLPRVYRTMEAIVPTDDSTMNVDALPIASAEVQVSSTTAVRRGANSERLPQYSPRTSPPTGRLLHGGPRRGVLGSQPRRGAHGAGPQRRRLHRVQHDDDARTRRRAHAHRPARVDAGGGRRDRAARADARHAELVGDRGGRAVAVGQAVPRALAQPPRPRSSTRTSGRPRRTASSSTRTR